MLQNAMRWGQPKPSGHVYAHGVTMASRDTISLNIMHKAGHDTSPYR